MLDVVVKTKNEILSTDFTSTKTAYSHQYHYYNSCHTEHIKYIIYNETLRWRRICSERKDLTSDLEDFKGDILDQVRCFFLSEILDEFFLLQTAVVKIVNFWRSIKKAKHLTKKYLHCTCKAIKNITQFFDQKIVNELYNEISQPTVVLKHDNILLKIANFFLASKLHIFFHHSLRGKQSSFCSWPYP